MNPNSGMVWPGSTSRSANVAWSTSTPEPVPSVAEKSKVRVPSVVITAPSAGTAMVICGGELSSR